MEFIYNLCFPACISTIDLFPSAKKFVVYLYLIIIYSTDGCNELFICLYFRPAHKFKKKLPNVNILVTQLN